MISNFQKLRTLEKFATTGVTHKSHCGSCCNRKIREELEALHFYNDDKFLSPNGYERVMAIFAKIEEKEELTLFEKGLLKVLAKEYNRTVKDNFFVVVQTEHTNLYIETIRFPKNKCARLWQFFTGGSEDAQESSLSSLTGGIATDDTSSYTTF